MPKIIIHLTDKEFEKVKKTVSNNGRIDIEHETFSGTEIKLEMSPFGNFMKIKGYSECEIDNVYVEFKNSKKLLSE